MIIIMTKVTMNYSVDDGAIFVYAAGRRSSRAYPLRIQSAGQPRLCVKKDDVGSFHIRD